MKAPDTECASHGGKPDRRHLAGFRKFQRAALKAVDAVSRLLDGDEDKRPGAPVKVSDMRSLVSAYNDAVVGERMVLGIGAVGKGARPADWPDEMVVRWVDDVQQVPDAEDADA